MKSYRSLPIEPKGQNFSYHEKLLVLDLIAEHGQGLIDENDTMSLFRRSRIWRVIYTQYNKHHGVSERTEKQLRLLWKNLKARCKREFRLNAEKYRTPGHFIQDPLLRKMSTLIGVEDDPCKSRRGPKLAHPAAGKYASSNASKIRGNPQNVARPSQNQFLPVSPSPIQIARTYTIAPLPIASSAQYIQTMRSNHEQVTISGPNLDHDVATIEKQKSDSTEGVGRPDVGPGVDHDQRTEIVKNACVEELTKQPASEQKRRKKGVPRKSTDVVKEEIIDCDDDDLDIQMKEDGWQEVRHCQQNAELEGTYVRDFQSSTVGFMRDVSITGPVLKNNLHHQMPIRQLRPHPAKAKERPRSNSRYRIENSPTSVDDERADALLAIDGTESAEQTETAPVTLETTGEAIGEGTESELDYHQQVLKMAKQEHDMKMATMLMKRKQIMQIKRREHLAKMENYRLNKEILRLKKRKLELEIKNGMYLDEVENELQNDEYR